MFRILWIAELPDRHSSRSWGGSLTQLSSAWSPEEQAKCMVDQGSIPESGATGQVPPSSGSQDRRREEKSVESRTATDCMLTSLSRPAAAAPSWKEVCVWGGGGEGLSLTSQLGFPGCCWLHGALWGLPFLFFLILFIYVFF